MNFDLNNETAKYLFDEFKHNLKVWAEEHWTDKDVKIFFKDDFIGSLEEALNKLDKQVFWGDKIV